ncbi:uncharacterized protein PHACADRAFT_173327 [Phanerochaete carnosa HHB-10118-sp]|uniref:MYND-type domain-containing protein n=1 Tax=Phanerochaete carnosa (strain HHB-10118-sp) TaxID=650164 RepID=K5W7U1_PHACS|nr:uncharacterized protein PHACADRAFT_173327 [Phanerochaete carnosa HHB-10118-sp]EKM55240.1 hypothetical protein PHACADRAFT_173327 [Phanerochaete carnosa HHB-10118-sp]
MDGPSRQNVRGTSSARVTVITFAQLGLNSLPGGQEEEEKPTFLPVDSREARLAHDSCYNPECSMSRRETKMFNCAGCGVILYCSRACQRAHWPAHRAQCKCIQSERATILRGDAEARRRASSVGRPVLLPSQVTEEYRDFIKHFKPHILLASVEMYRAGPNDPRIVGWEEDAILFCFRRRKEFPPNAPSWSRFYLDRGHRVDLQILESVVEELPESENFLAEKPVWLAEARRRGRGHGCIVTWTVCGSEVGAIQGPYPQMFSPCTAASERLLGVNPITWLETAVEKLSTEAWK